MNVATIYDLGVFQKLARQCSFGSLLPNSKLSRQAYLCMIQPTIAALVGILTSKMPGYCTSFSASAAFPCGADQYRALMQISQHEHQLYQAINTSNHTRKKSDGSVHLLTNAYQVWVVSISALKSCPELWVAQLVHDCWVNIML